MGLVEASMTLTSIQSLESDTCVGVGANRSKLTGPGIVI